MVSKKKKEREREWEINLKRLFMKPNLKIKDFILAWFDIALRPIAVMAFVSNDPFTHRDIDNSELYKDFMLKLWKENL